MDAVEDIVSKQVATMFIKDEDEKKAAREALADGPLAIRRSESTTPASLERSNWVQVVQARHD
jgi:hypothetical protein